MTFEYEDISHRTKLLILLLSLLINTILIILILNSHRQQFILSQAQVIKLDEEEIVTPSQFMQPNAQNMPAPSTPLNAPAQPQPQQQPLPQQQDFEWVSGAAGLAKPGEPGKEKKAEKKEPEPQPEEEAFEEQKETNEESLDTETLNTESKQSIELPDKPNTIPAGSAVIAEEPELWSKQEFKSQSQSQSKKSSKPTKQLPSLAELTKNFMDFTTADEAIGNGNGGGMHAMGVHGGKSGPVSEKQLTYERYLRKLLMCISTSCKIHKREIPRTKQNSQARVQFALNREGTYYTLGLAQSSGNAAIDDLILAIFKDAESSFPPVPQSLSAPLIAPTFLLNSVQELLTPETWSVSIGS